MAQSTEIPSFAEIQKAITDMWTAFHTSMMTFYNSTLTNTSTVQS